MCRADVQDKFSCVQIQVKQNDGPMKIRLSLMFDLMGSSGGYYFYSFLDRRKTLGIYQLYEGQMCQK